MGFFRNSFRKNDSFVKNNPCMKKVFFSKWDEYLINCITAKITNAHQNCITKDQTRTILNLNYHELETLAKIMEQMNR